MRSVRNTTTSHTAEIILITLEICAKLLSQLIEIYHSTYIWLLAFSPVRQGKGWNSILYLCLDR